MITFILGITSLGFFILDGVNIVRNTVIPSVKRMKGRDIDTSKIVMANSYILFMALYVNFIQKINKTITKIDKNRYEVMYTIRGVLYKMVVNQTVGPPKILLVSDENGDDVTDDILPYLGPENDFHGNNFYPVFFGKKSLELVLINGDSKTFEHNEIIKLDLNKKLE